jgi:hypothetical protein
MQNQEDKELILSPTIVISCVAYTKNYMPTTFLWIKMKSFQSTTTSNESAIQRSSVFDKSIHFRFFFSLDIRTWLLGESMFAFFLFPRGVSYSGTWANNFHLKIFYFSQFRVSLLKKVILNFPFLIRRICGEWTKIECCKKSFWRWAF